jgi:hypothetical protein
MFTILCVSNIVIQVDSGSSLFGDNYRVGRLADGFSPHAVLDAYPELVSIAGRGRKRRTINNTAG